MTRQYNESNCELRFLLPSKAAGVIIGKGGESVKEIREKFEIKVNLPDSSGPERVLQLIGRSSNIFDALEVILSRAKECFPASECEYYSTNLPSRRRVSSKSHKSDSEEESDDLNQSTRNNGNDSKNSDKATSSESAANEVDVRLLIHHKLAGSIIGRGGERIRELRHQSNLAVLKLYQVICPKSTDRVVQLAGPISKCVSCIREIVQILDSASNQIRSGLDQSYDAHNFDESQALLYGGWLSRGAFKNLMDSGPQAFMQHMAASSSSSARGADLSNGGIHAIHTAFAAARGVGAGMLQNPLIAAGMLAHQLPLVGLGACGNGGANPMMMMGMMMPPPPVSNAANKTDCSRFSCSPGAGVAQSGSGVNKTVQVSVPNVYVGAIMGRGGIRIRSVREESGADIRVHEADKSGGDRIIEITGTQQQISYAQHLLKSCVLQN